MDIDETKYDNNDIRSVQNIYYIGQIILKTEEERRKSQGFWKINYIQNKKLIKKSCGRIYFIVINNLIKKIGLSECKGGIKNTFNAYQGGLGGSPSIRTRGIHLLINKELEKENIVEIYSLFYEPIKMVIKGLWFSEETEVCISMKKVEDICREQYKAVNGDYPDWNFQEKYEEWPLWVKQEHEKYKNEKNDRKNRKKVF